MKCRAAAAALRGAAAGDVNPAPNEGRPGHAMHCYRQRLQLIPTVQPRHVHLHIIEYAGWAFAAPDEKVAVGDDAIDSTMGDGHGRARHPGAGRRIEDLENVGHGSAEPGAQSPTSDI